MKNIFNTISKLTFIYILIILSSCEAEKDFATQDKIIVRRFSMKDITAKSNSKLNQAINNIKTLNSNTITDSSNSKLVFDEKTGLYFDDEKGLYIEKDNLKSYTFPIIRTSADEKIKNICFNEKQDGNYDVFLVKYDLTKQEELTLTEEQKESREKQFITLMKDGVAVDLFRFYCINIVMTVTTEYAAPIDNGDLTGNFGYTTGSNTTSVVIGSGCFFDNGNSGSGFNQGLITSGNYNNTGTIIGTNPVPVPAEDIITGLNTLDFDNNLTDGEIFYYNYTDFMHHINQEQKDFFNNNSQLINYLLNNYWSNDSKELVVSIIDTMIDYQNAFGITDESNEIVNDFINVITNGDYNATDEGIVNPAPPDCDSFNFTTNPANTAWQQSAVINIHFTVVVLTPQGNYVSHVVNYPQPILFGAPTNITIGNTDITPGMAASLSAQALATSMNETVKKYGNKPVSEMMVQLYFESRLKHNYPLFIPGGRVNIHPTNYNVTPTQYQTNLFGTGNCN